MKISLTPVRCDAEISVTVTGDALCVNGETFDFSELPEGGLLPQSAVACVWLASDVERLKGEITLSLLLPHGVDAPDQTLFPDPLDVIEDGMVTLPPYGRDRDSFEATEK